MPVEEARDRVRAVFATIREAVTLGEFRDLLEQLDPEMAFSPSKGYFPP